MKQISLLARLLALTALAWAGSARAEIVNVAGEGIPYADRALFGNNSIFWLIDQDRNRALHADTDDSPALSYAVDLRKSRLITHLRIFPRQDGCCPDRFSNVRVSIHADAAGSPGPELWGQTLFGDGSNPGSGPGVVVEVTLPAPQQGQWVKLEALDNPPKDYALQVTELEIYADVPPSEVNRALGKVATANQPLFGSQNAQSLIDGSRASAIHGVESPAPGFAYTINLGATVSLSRLVLWPRQDVCCPDRLTNFRISVLSDNNGQPGAVVWKSDQFTDGSYPPTDPGTHVILTADLDPAGTFRGQWIRIETLENPIVSLFPLQLSEVEAFGVSEGGVNVLVSQPPRSTSTGPGRTASFSVAAVAVNGDNAEIDYQWLKNGEPIPDATEAQYTTPPVLIADDKALYSVRISYTGVPTITTSAAELRVNLAFQADASFNRPLWPNGGWNIGMIVDGNRGVAVHGDATIDPGAEITINLGADITFEEIDIYPRQDGCCPDRLRNLRISLHPDNGGVPGPANWETELFTDGTDAGSGPGVVVNILAALDTNPGRKFQGQWIKILNLEDPVTPYAMQLAEVEAYGAFTFSQPVLSVFAEPADFATVPGRVARFSVEGRVVNGNPANITYQWQKNGEDIPGATEGSYTTPPLTAADDGALYRAIVSYPGIANVPSRAARGFFDGNYAKNQPAFSNRPLWAPGNWNAGMLVDGNRAVAIHADTAPATGMSYEIDLGVEVDVTRIDIYPRQGECCPERFADVRVSLHDNNNGAPGDQNWHVDLFTDGSNAGSGPGVVVQIDAAMGTGTFKGSWLRILALTDPPIDYAMQLAEVEVFGTAQAVVTPTLGIVRAVDGPITITYSGGALQSAPSLTGPWSAVTGATSPFVVSPTADSLLFRVRQ